MMTDLEKKTKYYYEGEVLLRWPDNGVTKRQEKRLISADSIHDAYSKLSDMILTEEVYDHEYSDFVKHIDFPALEFHGEMTKAINSFERDEVNERDG